MEFLHYLGEWTMAVIEHWEGYVSGGIVGLGLEFSKRFRDWEPSKKVFAGIVALGFLASIFSAWKDERVKYEAEAEKRKAHLEFNYAQLITSAFPFPQYQDNTAITIIGTISNNGLLPSFVRGWTLKVRLPNEFYDREAYLIGTNAKIAIFGGGVEQLSWEKAYLPEITAAGHSISGGDGRSGFLLFRFPVSFNPVMKGPGIRYHLCYEDVNQITSCKDMTSTGIQGQPLYFPGIPRE